jgi:hypothetical protein
VKDQREKDIGKELLKCFSLDRENKMKTKEKKEVKNNEKNTQKQKSTVACCRNHGGSDVILYGRLRNTATAESIGSI